MRKTKNTLVSCLAGKTQVVVTINDFTMKRVITVKNAKNELLKFDRRSFFCTIFGFTEWKIFVGSCTNDKTVYVSGDD